MKTLIPLLLVLWTFVFAACSGGESGSVAPESEPPSSPAAEDSSSEAPPPKPGEAAPTQETSGAAGGPESAAADGTEAAKPDEEPMGEVPEGASVHFIEPKDGATVSSPVRIVMGVEGMEIVPAGMRQDRSGHHHLLIDQGPIPFGTVIPKDEIHIHYGGAQTEAKVKLTPGKHLLTLQLADWGHRSFGDQLSTSVTVTVSD